MNKETKEQKATVDMLARKGFRVDRVFDCSDEPYVFVCMSRKRRYITHLAQVEYDGSVNGQSAREFLASFKK